MSFDQVQDTFNPQPERERLLVCALLLDESQSLVQCTMNKSDYRRIFVGSDHEAAAPESRLWSKLPEEAAAMGTWLKLYSTLKQSLKALFGSKLRANRKEADDKDTHLLDGYR